MAGLGGSEIDPQDQKKVKKTGFFGPPGPALDQKSEKSTHFFHVFDHFWGYFWYKMFPVTVSQSGGGTY
jgi:hypothetical protein